MAKIKPIDVTKSSFSDYRRWLTDIAERKKQLEENEQRRLKVMKELNQLRKKVNELSSEEYRLGEYSEEIRAELIEAIPSRF